MPSSILFVAQMWHWGWARALLSSNIWAVRVNLSCVQKQPPPQKKKKAKQTKNKQQQPPKGSPKWRNIRGASNRNEVINNNKNTNTHSSISDRLWFCSLKVYLEQVGVKATWKQSWNGQHHSCVQAATSEDHTAKAMKTEVYYMMSWANLFFFFLFFIGKEWTNMAVPWWAPIWNKKSVSAA